MNSLRVSVILMTVQRYYAMALNFIVMAIASRILRPEEIGLALVGSLIAITALSIREFASTHFLVQKSELTNEDKRAATSFLALITMIGVAALAFSAPWIASAYDEPQLKPYLWIVCICAVLEFIVTPVLGLLQRDMEFVKVAVITTIQATMTAVFTVACALMGFSTMSFAWAWFAAALSGAIIALYYWRDYSIFRPLMRGWRGIIVFGWYYGANQMLARIYEAVPSLLLGRFISVGAVGYYNRAMQICQLPEKVFLSGLLAVAVPAFSAKQRDNQSLKGPYLRGISYITALQWPTLVTIAILAHPIVDILLGSQWYETAPIIQIVALALLFSFTFHLNFPILIALGALRDLFIRALIVWPISAVALSIGAYFGLKVMALCLFIATPVQAVVAIKAVRRHVAISWTEIFLALRLSTIVTLCCAAGPLAVIAGLDFRFDLSIVEGIGLGALAGLGWLAGLWLTKHPLLDEVYRGISTVQRWRVAARDEA